MVHGPKDFLFFSIVFGYLCILVCEQKKKERKKVFIVLLKSRVVKRSGNTGLDRYSPMFKNKTTTDDCISTFVWRTIFNPARVRRERFDKSPCLWIGMYGRSSHEYGFRQFACINVPGGSPVARDSFDYDPRTRRYCPSSLYVCIRLVNVRFFFFRTAR